MSYERMASKPPGLEILISTANMIPAGIEPPNPFVYKNERAGTPDWFGNAPSPEERKRDFWERISVFPKLAEYLSRAGDDERRFYEDYDFFIAVREILNKVVERSEESRQYLANGQVMWCHDPVNVRLRFQMSVNFKNDGLDAGTNDGKIRFEGEVITKILTGCELIRFRRCRICQDIFWAKKLNAKTCSQKCSKIRFNLKRSARKKSQNAGWQDRNKWLKETDFSPNRKW